MKTPLAVCSLLVVLAGAASPAFAPISCGAAIRFGQTSATGYRSELAAARGEVVETGRLTIRNFDLGDPHPGKNLFAAVAKNDSTETVTLGLDLRAVPGFWLAPNVQSQYLYPVAPHQERQVSGEYEFSRLSAESVLRVRFFFPKVGDNGVTELGKPFFEKKYAVGLANPADDFDLSKLFGNRTTEHLVVYWARSLGTNASLDAEVARREAAYRRISQILGVASPQPVRLVFYADAASKTRDTHHTGDGLAYDDTIIEVYGKVDPFHELTHILARQLGDPLAMFNEGVAVYVSEWMGADALNALGSPGMKIDEAVAAHRRRGSFIPLDTLFTSTDIGPDESRPTVSYAEAASFVKFLITKYGLGLAQPQSRAPYAPRDSPYALEQQAMQAHNLKHHALSVEFFDKAFAAGLDRLDDDNNAACSAALAGQRSKAFSISTWRSP